MVSAKTGKGLDELKYYIASHLIRDERFVSVSIPFQDGRFVDLFHREGKIEKLEFTPEGTLIEGRIPARFETQFRVFQCQPKRRPRNS